MTAQVINTNQSLINGGISFETIVDRFLSVEDVKQSSKNLYKRQLKIFFEWIDREGKNVKELTKSDIVSYKESLLNSGLSPLTIGGYLTALRKFYTWLESEKIYPNIAKGIKTPKKKQAFKKQHLTAEKSVELINVYKNYSLRDYAIINLMLRAGLRTIEIIRLNLEDITFKQNQRILKIWGKGKDCKDDYIILTDTAYAPLKQYIETRKGIKGNTPLFVSNSNRNNNKRLTTRTISSICKKGLTTIGLDGKEFTAHSLRHTTAVSILKAGGNISDVQAVLRHRNINTSEIYIESVKEELRLKNAPERLIDNLF